MDLDLILTYPQEFLKVFILGYFSAFIIYHFIEQWIWENERVKKLYKDAGIYEEEFFND